MGGCAWGQGREGGKEMKKGRVTEWMSRRMDGEGRLWVGRGRVGGRRTGETMTRYLKLY